MSGRRRRKGIPSWAERQRQRDLDWIAENLFILWPTAQEQFKTSGRGAVVVDTTAQPIPGAGHPISYFPEAMVIELGSEDERRLVAQYNPEIELVVILIKPGGKVSGYRLQQIISPSFDQN